VLLIDVIFII